MRVSIDFDDCLTKKSIQKLAKTLLQSGVDVWIVTSRSGKFNTNHDVEVMANKLGIKTENCVFVGDWKHNFFSTTNTKFDYHIDDYYYEIETINEKCKFPVAIPCDLGLFFKECLGDKKYLTKTK